MTTIVGRNRELQAVDAFLGGDAGSARVLLIVGEAGIGKTTLWEESLRRAEERGFRVAASRASPAETRLAFSAVGDLLRDHVDDLRDMLPAPQARALSVALLLDDAGGPSPEPSAIAIAVLTSLRTLAASAPLVVALDDVQWLDQPSAAALAFALRRLGRDDVAFVIAQRVTESADPLPLGLDRTRGITVERVELGPLSAGALHNIVGRELGRSFSRPTLLRLHADTNGNPLYALEVARARARARPL